MSDRLRVLELFCGIGGCAAALGDRAEIVAALDINRVALSVYRHNFRHPVQACAIESLSARVCRGYEADLWWMSPPCQPYTVRGRRLDVDDPRAESLLTVIERIAEIRPRYVALENVPGFCGSRAHQRLRATLDANGYEVREQVLCPTQLGIPNRRRRFYLVAARSGGLRQGTWGDLPAAGGETSEPWDTRSAPDEPRRLWRFAVREILDADPPDPLWVPDELVGRYRTAIHVVDADDAQAESHCFTSSYGQCVAHSGSYLAAIRGEQVCLPDDLAASLGEIRPLVVPPSGGGDRLQPALQTPSFGEARVRGGVRRFSPREILRLLCFPPEFRLPEPLSLRKAWDLVGNSLSVVAVRHVLAAVPELGEAGLGNPCSPPTPCRIASAGKIR